MKKVLVIGDGCKDVFQYGKCERLSPEAPVPVFKPLRAINNGGMAVNVYNNLKGLGVECDIITDSGITKTRIVDEVSNQMLLRVDENDEISPIRNEQLETIDFTQYDAVVISDYGKGFLDEEDIEYISKKHKYVFMDTKKEISNWSDKIFCIKVNNKEYQRNKPWLDHMFENALVVTLGDKGAKYSHLKKNIKEEIFPNTNEHPVRDLTGAGDTFMAGLVAKFIENNDICDAIIFANRCAAWAVTQKGVAVADKWIIG
jgi:D-beta-D-heptose 7-phosphate kinase/D-beta-D-heptose 1-phosphate adenosyltransferase